MYFHSKFKIHKLIGDANEAFYQLGLIDKNFLENHFEHLKTITNTGNRFIDTLLNNGLGLYAKYTSNQIKEHAEHFIPYLEAQNISLSQFSQVMIYPELMTGLAQFLPLNFVQLGCSSIFYKNRNKDILHLRVLDFPLHDTYTKSDRFLYTDLPGSQKVFSAGPQGMPLHSLTATNESGLSMSVHQKFDQHFNPNGTPVLLISNHMINTCHSLEEVKAEAKKFESMGSWGIHFCDKNGKILSLEYSKNKMSFKEHFLEENEFVYINNQLFDTPFGNALPASINMYNHERDRFFDLMKKKISNRKTIIDHTNFAEIIDKATVDILKKNQDICIPFFTPSSVQISCINLNQQSMTCINGDAPKSTDNGLIIVNDIFNEQKIDYIEPKASKKKKEVHEIHRGKKALMQAQVAFDYKNIDECYHHLQMAMDYLSDTSLSQIAQFYFIALNIFHLKNRKSLSDMIVKLKNIHDQLPEYLQQQSFLMQLRVQLMYGMPFTDLEKNLTHPILKNVWENEKNFMGWALQPILRKTALLRIDMFDIIYLHSRCE